jgi:hypothetical protein
VLTSGLVRSSRGLYCEDGTSLKETLRFFLPSRHGEPSMYSLLHHWSPLSEDTDTALFLDSWTRRTTSHLQSRCSVCRLRIRLRLPSEIPRNHIPGHIPAHSTPSVLERDDLSTTRQFAAALLAANCRNFEAEAIDCQSSRSESRLSTHTSHRPKSMIRSCLR